MNNINIEKYPLDFKKTLPYFVDHIKCGNNLSSKITTINFQQGDFFTFLPDGSNLERLYEFSYAGVLLSFSLNKDLEMHLTGFIEKYISNSSRKWAFLENLLVDFGSPYASIDNVKLISYDKEVYYVLGKNNDIDEILEVIRSTEQVWHFLIILAELNEIKSEYFTDEDLNLICHHAKFIITSAYDGEGYVFWEKRG